MPKPVKGPRLGGSAAHQKHIVRNLAKDLIRHGRITTTLKKAKVTQPFVERLVKYAKKGDLHNIRMINKFLDDKSLTRHMVVEVGPKNADRPGGATRVVKIGPRKSDQAPMVIFEWTDNVAPFEPKANAVEATTVKSGRAWGRRKSADEAAAEETKEPVKKVDETVPGLDPEKVSERLADEEADEETKED